MGTLFTQEDIMKTLNTLYKKTVDGLGAVSPPVSDLAKDYLKMNSNVDTATQIMQAAQIAKCTTSGFVTGFGGLLALPVTVPANITSVLYVQMRMIACTAHMAGYDVKSDQVQTFVYACPPVFRCVKHRSPDRSLHPCLSIILLASFNAPAVYFICCLPLCLIYFIIYN